jgi:hypothetical protein
MLSSLMNMRIPSSSIDMQIVNEFIQKIGFDVNKICKVPALPGKKGKFGSCNKHCEEKVKQFGGEIVFGINIDMDHSKIYASYHVVWKYNNKLYDITEPEIGQEHQKNGILFVPTNEPTKYIFRPNTNRFPPNIVHIYSKRNLELPEEIIKKIFIQADFIVI